MVSSPRVPSAAETAAAQSGMNLDTAQATQLTNMTNQVGPWGSTTYNPTGSSSFVDSTGKTVTIPQYTQTTTYNPAQQAIFDKTTQTQTNLADLAVDQSDMFKDYLKDPFTFTNDDASNWSYDLAQGRIAPQQAEATDALRTQLINQGLRPGTPAWDSEMRRNTNAITDQNNQLALTGRQQAFNEQAYTRSAPINELSALLSGSQIGAPNAGTSATPQTSVGGVDYGSLVNQEYQAKSANSAAGLGGLFGLAGSLAGGGFW